jgi:hypothetical protein
LQYRIIHLSEHNFQQTTHFGFVIYDENGLFGYEEFNL